MLSRGRSATYFSNVHTPNVCVCVQAVDFNIFEGMEVHGVPEYVISQGRVVVEKGEVKVVKGSGRFIPRQPWSDFVYSRVFQRDKVTLLPHQCSPGHNAGLSRSVCRILIWAKLTIWSCCAQVCQPKKVERDPYTGPVLQL